MPNEMQIDDWLRSHVERCLQDVLHLATVEPDDDGEYPFCCETAAGWVRLETGDPTLIRVWAIAAEAVKRSPKLMYELNEINGRARLVDVVLVEDHVIVESVVHAGGLTRETLADAIEAVRCVADDVGPLIAAVHGGGTPLDLEVVE